MLSLKNIQITARTFGTTATKTHTNFNNVGEIFKINKIFDSILKFKANPKSIKENLVLRGWVESSRRLSKKLVFINLRTSDPVRLQCVLNAELNQPLSDETLVELEGKLSEIPAKAHANFNVEFKIDNMNILQKPCSSSNVSEIKSKIKRSRANPKIYTILALRNIITQKLHKIFSEDLQFLQIPPKILTNYVFEGSTNSAFVASTPKQPNNSKYLTQSNQLYLQSALPALGNVYSISSCFRNEAIPSNRHLKEFVQLEAEYFCRDFDFLIEVFQYVLIKLSESLLKTEYSAKLDSAIIENVLKSSHNLLNLKTITYSHAVDILKSNGQLENKIDDDVVLNFKFN